MSGTLAKLVPIREIIENLVISCVCGVDYLLGGAVASEHRDCAARFARDSEATDGI